jgi:hypothetical protein
MKIEHHSYYADDYSRKAIVFKYKDDPAWYVDLLEAGSVVETRKMETNGVLHSERYAEDCGENWVLRIF